MKLFFRTIIILLKYIGLVVFSLSCLSAYAEKIHVVTEYLTPYQMLDDSGKLTGLSTEILEALIAITGDEYEVQVLPWARAYLRALDTPNTLIYSISRTPHREPLFHWIGGIRTDKIHLWGLRGKFSKPISDVNQLKNHAIALVRSSYAEQYLRDSMFTNIYPVVSFEQSLKMLYRGRIDLILGDEVTLIPRINQLNYDANKLIKLAEVKEISAELSFAFSLKTNDVIVKRYQSAYQTLIKSGKLAEIKRKWHLSDNP